MKRVLVIADDLSGAAEMAGLGFRRRLAARIVTWTSHLGAFEPGLTAIDTDSRLLAPDDAAARIAQVAAHVRADDFDLIYKKTDSAMRGPIRAEIDALRKALNRSSAVLVAQNPSRGRTVVNGEYRIHGVPLHQTAFADDPEWPAHSSNVVELLGRGDRLTVADAASIKDVADAARQIDGTFLPSGGADFFEALLDTLKLPPQSEFTTALHPGKRLFVRGSAAPPTLTSIPTFPMQYDQGPWTASVIFELEHAGVAMMTIDRPVDRSAGAPLRFQAALADAVAEVLRRVKVRTILLEGGGTASAVCRKMGWKQLTVIREFATGVVHLRCREQHIVIKPGSYAWPAAVWNDSAES